MNSIPNQQSEYKQLAGYLYCNLNKDFKQFYHSTKATNSNANSKACASLNTLNHNELEDRKASFITYVLPVLVERGATLASYKEKQQTVLNSYRNMMIDMWRKQQTERKHIIHLETIYSEDGEDMTPTNNIPDTTALYDYSIDKLWVSWAGFVTTLSAKEQQLTLSFMGVSSATLATQLNIPERTVRYQVQKLRSSFLTYVENVRAEEDINIDEELLGINMEKN